MPEFRDGHLKTFYKHAGKKLLARDLKAVATLNGEVIGMPEDAEDVYAWQIVGSGITAPPPRSIPQQQETYPPRLLPA